MSEALAQAIERHKAALAAYDAWPDRSDDENLNRFCIEAGDALSDLADTRCANDAEFLTKLRYLLAAEMHVIGEPPIGNQEYGSPFKAAYFTSTRRRDDGDAFKPLRRARPRLD